MRIRSSAPTRLDLAGGTLDIWPLHLLHEGARTLNAAITLRAECVLTENARGGLRVTSHDTGTVLEAPGWSALTGREEPRLVSRILHHFQAERLTVETRSQSPVGAGLAGSSALNVALCAALAAWRRRTWTREALIDLALNLEAQVIEAPTGCQDYWPAVFGGVSCIEFGPAGVRRRVLPVAAHELERRIVIAHTGDSHDSGVNNWEIVKRRLDGDRQVTDALDGIRDVAAAMQGALERRDWAEVGRRLGEEWALRKRLAPGVSTPAIEALVDRGRAAGARAAKVCGAGGGGCVLLFADPSDVPAVREAAAAGGAQLLDFGIDGGGLRIDRDSPPADEAPG